MWLALCAVGLTSAGSAAAPVPQLESTTEINRKVTNPVSVTWSLKVQNDLFLLDLEEHGSQAQDTVVFQPVLPVFLTRDLKLIPRPKFTFLDSKPYTGPQGNLNRATGFGDTVLDLVLSPKLEAWLLALGPTFVFPTATLDQTGQGKWQIGPGGVFGYQTKTWLAGVIFQQWFSFAGSASRPDVSELNLQYIAGYFFGDGWSIGTSPTIAVDWRESSGNQVTFPFGPTLGKVVKVGGTLPVKFEISVFYIPIHPENGRQFQLQLNVIPVVRSPFHEPFSGE